MIYIRVCTIVHVWGYFDQTTKQIMWARCTPLVESATSRRRVVKPLRLNKKTLFTNTTITIPSFNRWIPTKTLKYITINATTIPSFNRWISMDGSGLTATLRSLPQTYLAGGKIVERYLLNSASRKVHAGWCKQIFQSENKKSLKAEEDTGKLLKAILPNRQTFWSRTGELGKAQPDNYNGQKAGRQYNQHHFHICH